jgi:hypothetical protein
MDGSAAGFFDDKPEPVALDRSGDGLVWPQPLVKRLHPGCGAGDKQLIVPAMSLFGRSNVSVSSERVFHV